MHIHGSAGPRRRTRRALLAAALPAVLAATALPAAAEASNVSLSTDSLGQGLMQYVQSTAEASSVTTEIKNGAVLVYFRALAPGQYLVVAPMFVTNDDPAARVVVLEPGLPVQDMQPGGLVSGPDVRAYATREARPSHFHAGPRTGPIPLGSKRGSTSSFAPPLDYGTRRALEANASRTQARRIYTVRAYSARS